MVGVLAVIAILAAMLVPAIIKRIDFAAWAAENASLSAMKDALVQHVVRSNNIPGSQTTWAAAISSELGLAPANITTTPRNYHRFYLIDTSGWLGPALASGDWNQAPGGETSAPSGARLMIVSQIGGPALDSYFPKSTPNPTDFANIWNTPQGATPNTLVSWSGNANDLLVQRINLEPLFHRVILVNGAGGPGYFTIYTNNPAAVSPGASGTNIYYLDGTALNLYDATATNLLAREVIRNDMSRFFEYSVWRDQINVGITNSPPASSGYGLLAATFLASATIPNASSGETPQAILGLLSSYMNGYSAWANMNPPFSYGPGGTNYMNGSFAPYNAISGALNSSGIVPPPQ